MKRSMDTPPPSAQPAIKPAATSPTPTSSSQPAIKPAAAPSVPPSSSQPSLKPAQSVQSAQVAQSAQSAQAAQPTQPSQPSQPSRPSQPTQSSQPAKTQSSSSSQSTPSSQSSQQPKPTQQPSQPSPKPSPLKFRFANAGAWFAKQENPFAAQNRRDAEQKAKHDKRLEKVTNFFRKLGIPAIIIGVAALVVLIVIAFIIAHVFSSQNTDDSIPETVSEQVVDSDGYFRDFRNQYEDNGKELAPVMDTINQTISDATSQLEANQIRVAEITFLSVVGEVQQSIEQAHKIDPKLLSAQQLLDYYYILYSNYSALGDQEKADDYFNRTLIVSERYKLGAGS